MSDLERKAILAFSAVAAVPSWARGLLALTIIWTGVAAAQSASAPAAAASALPQPSSTPASAPAQGRSANPSAPAQQPTAQPASAGTQTQAQAPSVTPATTLGLQPPGVPAPAVATGGNPAICAANRAAAEKAIVSGSALPVASAERRLVSAFPRIPREGLVQLYLFSKHAEVPGLTYRVFITAAGEETSDPGRPPARVLQVVGGDDLSAQDAARAPAPTNSQIRNDKSEKTLIEFASDPHPGLGRSWQATPIRFIVVGCTSADRPPTLFGTATAEMSSVTGSRVITVLMCTLLYLLAAFASFYVRVKQRACEVPEDWSDFRMLGSKPQQNQKGQTITGTNYASFWAHLDPVVLTAGANGKGSPAKLQILFFTIVVFGVMLYLLMLTGNLTDLSTKVLMLLGVSGVGAMAAGGAELAKNRLSFESYAWLERNKWIPRGGIAEQNRAEWKDIFTSDGEFDVSRFQMVAFSFVVAISLVAFALRLNDLAGFDISDALLGLLGLSQVLYVGGKLIAPPAIRDLDAKLADLRKLEQALRDARDKAGLAGVAFIFGTRGPEIIAASATYTEYKTAWAQARTMFESTLGRDVPEEAENFCPPFTMAQVTDDEEIRLPDKRVGRDFSMPVTAVGGTGPYDWSLNVAKAAAADLRFASTQSSTIEKSGASSTDIIGNASVPAVYRFSVTVKDSTGTTKVRNFTFAAT